MQDLKKSIAKLDPKELEAVRDYCNLLLGTTAVVSSFSAPTPARVPPGGRSRVETNVNLLYDAVAGQLNHRFRQSPQPYSTFIRIPDKKRLLVSAADRLTQFCQANLPTWDSTVFVSVCTRFARYTADDLETYGVPVTVKNILQAVDRWEDTLDRRFPGYLPAGMISVVFLSKTNRLHRREILPRRINKLG